MRICTVSFAVQFTLAACCGSLAVGALEVIKDSIVLEAHAEGVKEGKEQGKIEQLLTNNLSALTEYKVSE